MEETSTRHPSEKRHFKAYLVFIVIFMTMGSFTFGYASAVIGTTLGQPSFFKHMGLDVARNAESLISSMVCLFFGGGVFGAFAQGWVSGRWGRKGSIGVGCIVIIVSSALLTASVNPAMFITMRFFNGFGGTMLLSAVPLWITEIVPPRNRGMLTDIHAVQLNVGTVVSGYIGIGFFFTSNSDSWRAPIALQMVPAFVLLCGLHWMPESPRYLLSKGRKQEAWDIIYRLHSDPNDSTHEFAKKEFYQMQKQTEFDNALTSTYYEIFRKPSYRKRALLTMFLTWSLISGGCFVINNYGAILYADLGYDSLQSLLFQAGWTVTSLFANSLAMTYVDRFRRDYLIAIGFFLTGCAMLVEALLQKNYLGSKNSTGLGAAVAMLFIYNLFYGMFLDGAAFFYVGEIWPSHLRAKGYAIGIGVLELTALIWASAAPTAFATIGWEYYLIFVIFSFIGCVVTLLVLPNTLHKPLEEIAGLFGDTDEVMVFQAELGNDVHFEFAGEGIVMNKVAPIAVHQENMGTD